MDTQMDNGYFGRTSAGVYPFERMAMETRLMEAV